MRLLLFVAIVAAGLHGATPTAWEMTSFQDFVKGRFKNLALTMDGKVTVAPRLETVLGGEEAFVWAVAAGRNGDVWVGTGHGGRVYRVTAGGQREVVLTAGEPEIFAVAAGANGVVYAASSPNGKIYRIEGRQASVYYTPEARYIWALAVGADGALYAGAGDDGKVYRVTGANQGEVWFDTGQSHVTALAVDAGGRLLAGTEPNGIVYRITGKEEAFALYDANFPEIRALAPAADGSVYVAAMGGAVGKQKQAAPATTPAVSSTIQVTAPATTITVTEEASAQNPPVLEVKPKAAPAQAAPAQAAPVAAAPVVEYAGMEKSAIVRIHPDNTVETLWTSKEENAYDLLVDGGGLLFGTDQQGRLYRLETNRKTTLVAETGEGQVLRLARAAGGVLVATGEQGKLYRLTAGKAESGEMESPVHDATTTARWGRLSFTGSGAITFRTRTGNAARVDKTWSAWSEGMTVAAGEQVKSPNARYVQWKVELRGEATLESARLAYLPQNTAPVVKSVTVSAQTAAAGARPAQTGQTATPTYSITVTETGEAGASSVSGTAAQPVTRASQEQLLVSWVSEDIDNDKLTYSLYFRGEGETAWKPLKLETTETSYTVDAEAFADGRYYFRVTVTDQASNPAPYARSGELVSAPILIDRTPPQLTVAPGAGAVRFRASDGASPLKFCDYTVDAGAWTPLAPVDGVVDSLEEEFELKLALGGGEHLVVLRCLDSANNAGLAKLVLR
jgi:sugar lactone lactonase YvrE